MSQESIITGLRYAVRHDLPTSEIEVLLKILENPCTALDLAAALDKSVTTIYHLLQTLKLKGILSVKVSEKKGAVNIYQFKESSLE